MAEKAENTKIPFKLRMKAWWEGYDLDDIRARMKTPGTEETEGEDGNSGAANSSVPIPEKDVSIMSWNELRIEMTQLIWGDGYCGPGGVEYVQKMSKLLTMTSEMSAIVVGAGLGGPARVLAEEYGVWISAYELSSNLAGRGMQLSIDAGMEKKAPILHMTAEQEKPFERKYERAFSKEGLYHFPDKAKILKDIYDTLKYDALFLVSDYTLSDMSALENHDVQKLLKQEPLQPYPMTPDTMKDAMEQTGFTIRVNEDISDEFIELIEASWSKAELIAKELAKKGKEGEDAIKTLMEEAEHWSLRAKLLKKGLIRVWRFLAHKPKKPIK